MQKTHEELFNDLLAFCSLMESVFESNMTALDGLVSFLLFCKLIKLKVVDAIMTHFMK